LGSNEGQNEDMLETEKKKKKKRILPIAKRGNVLPILLLLVILGSLVCDAAGVVKTVNNIKAAQCQIEELQRHNCVMEGCSIYLAFYKHGQDSVEKKTPIKC